MNLYAVGRPVVRDEGGYWIAYYVLAETENNACRYLNRQLELISLRWFELPSPVVTLVAEQFCLPDLASTLGYWPMSAEAAAGYLAVPARRLYAVGKQTGDWLRPWQACLVMATSPDEAVQLADAHYGVGWWHSHLDEATVVLVADRCEFAAPFTDLVAVTLPSSGGGFFPGDVPTKMPETDLGWHRHLP